MFVLHQLSGVSMAELKLSVALAVISEPGLQEGGVSCSLLRNLVFRDTSWGEKGAFGVL